MRFLSWRMNGARGLAIRRDSQVVNLEGLDLLSVLQAGEAGLARAKELAATGAVLDDSTLTYLPPLTTPPKIICVGMNYWDHARENKLESPEHPTFFARFASSLIGHEQPLIRPTVSEQLDFEGELAVIIGKPGRHIAAEKALEHVAGYAVFNDASVRDYQMRGQQWTLGKNFDGTGAFGPEFVTSDEVPAGGKGLRLTTKLNGEVVQSANTDELIFDVATLISKLSDAVTLEIGDVIVTGTPGGIGFFRTPKLFMRPGDVCEVEIEGIGTLRNRVQDEKL